MKGRATMLLAKGAPTNPMHMKPIVDNDNMVTFHPFATITHIKGQLSSMP